MKELNLLHEFFNSKSDACPLEASQQEALEKEFQDWFNERNKDLKFATEPLVKHMAENYHPHMLCLVDNCQVVLTEGLKSFENLDYILD